MCLQRGSVINQSNGGSGGRTGRAPVQRTTPAPGAKKLSWIESHDDVIFVANDNTKQVTLHYNT